MKFLKTIIFIFFAYIVNAQIQIGVELNFQSCSTPSIEENKFIKFEVKNPGFGFSCFTQTDILRFHKLASIGLLTTLGYSYDKINNISFHYPDNSEEIKKSKEFVGNLGLNYINNSFSINIKLLNFIIFESGIQNRFLFYRNFGANNNKYKGNKMELANHIPWLYSDLYYSLAIKIGNISIKYRIYDIDENIAVQDFKKPMVPLGQQKPIIYKIHKIHNFSLFIPIKSYESNKLPIYDF